MIDLQARPAAYIKLLALVAVLGLFAALFTSALAQIETSPVIAVAVVVSALLTALLALYAARRAADQAQPVLTTE